MKNYLFLFFCFISSISFTQIIQINPKSHPINQPKNGFQQAFNSKNIIKVYQYDNNLISSGIGVSAASYQMGAFIEIPSAMLKPYNHESIDYIRFGIDNNSIIVSLTVLIYEDSLTHEAIFEQEVPTDSIKKGWNLIQLVDGYQINDEKNIFIGVRLNTTEGGYTHTFDTDEATLPEYSGHITLNGGYYGTLLKKIGINADLNIHGIITDGQGPSYSDIKIVSVNPLSKNCELSDFEKLQITLLNNGEVNITDTFTLEASINNHIVTKKVTPTTWQPKTEMVVDMPGFDMHEFGAYTINASIDYPDTYPENNYLSETVLTGDAELLIHLTTDAFPEETYWELSDENNNTIASSGQLNAETTYDERLCVNSQKCYSWAIYDTYGDGLAGEDTIIGSFSVYYNDSLVSNSPVDGNFGKTAKVFGIGNGCKSNNVSITQAYIPTYDTPGFIMPKFFIKNSGTDTITSLHMQYQVENMFSTIDTVSGIHILPGETKEFIHSDSISLQDEKKYQVSFLVQNPNNKLDEDTLDNIYSKEIIRHQDVISKTMLIEHFTSSTCDPCFSFTPKLDAFLADEINYSIIRYPVNVPEPGDPYSIPASHLRSEYYSTNSIPAVYWNGQFNNSLVQSFLETIKQEKTIIELTGDAKYLNNTVTINLNLKSLFPLDTCVYTYFNIIEKTTTGNAANNGETEFSNIIMAQKRKQLTSEKKYSDDYSFTESMDLSGTYVEEMSDLDAIIFIQNNKNGEVIQNIKIPVLLADKITRNAEKPIKIYPNPCGDNIFIDNIDDKSSITIVNAVGKQFFQSQVISNSSIDISHLKNGFYFVIISNYQNNYVQKLVKSD